MLLERRDGEKFVEQGVPIKVSVDAFVVDLQNLDRGKVIRGGLGDFGVPCSQAEERGVVDLVGLACCIELGSGGKSLSSSMGLFSMIVVDQCLMSSSPVICQLDWWNQST